MEPWAQLVFFLSAFFLLYVLAGYPALLDLLARTRARPVRKRLEWRSVTILLTVRNGERWIREKLNSILALDYPRHLLQVLVISDGSEDATDRIVAELAPAGVQLIRIPKSSKAAALNAGIAQARGDILFFTDVRQRLEPESLKNLVACLGDPEVGVASGELVIQDGATRQEATVGLYWQYEKWIRKRLSRIDSVLGASGCIYAMRRELATSLPPDLLVDDVYLPLGAFFRGYRVVLDESARAVDYPTPLQKEFHRKVRTLAGIYQVLAACPALLSSSNRMWIHFVSHKLGRLFLPYALIAMALTTGKLPAPWAGIAAAIQVAVYGFAVLDLAIPEGWRLKRFSSLARTFVMMMIAAICAVSILFVPSSYLWREPKVAATRSAS